MQKENVREEQRLTQWTWSPVFKSEINQLILLHGILYLFYTLVRWLEVQSIMDIGLVSFVHQNLIVYLRIDDIFSFNWFSIFTYQFIHTRFSEILFNMIVLGFAGHLLAKQTSERHVVMLYFVGTFMSAVVFLLSHMVFNVLSGNAVMMGAQGGTLLVMAAAALHYRTTEVQVFNIRMVGWKLWILCVLLSFLIHYNNTIAYYFVVTGSTYAGARYAVWQLLRLKEARQD